jgi:lantibiotic leader peptide-processing serine protease
MRRISLLALLGAILLLVPLTADATKRAATTHSYVVLYERGASDARARAAIESAGGRVVEVNRKVGVATVRSANANFVVDVSRTAAVEGAARNRPVGYAKPDQVKDPFAIERMNGLRNSAAGEGRVREHGAGKSAAEPFADLQWDMRMINATPSKSYKRQRGSHAVRVGIIDTGVDGTHPDIAPNFNQALSRNFTTDIPLIDGPCEEANCVDPNNVDQDGHGTHVAGTVGAAINGLGMAGVAPGVQLINIRAGQDSGYFFLQPSVDALTYAGDIGVDVVNMSYYIDPWLYNCANNPADSPEQQLEQRTIIQATERALGYARRHGVTLVSALGNEQTDIGKPTTDETSPDFPPDTAYPRTVNNSCKSEPTEAPGVIGISSVGPSERKAYYSNYGVEQTDLSAPGGDRRDFFGTSRYNTPPNTVIAPYPTYDAVANGDLNPDGTPNNPFVLADCSRGPCAYYQYLQGTSMASPHAVGVAALVVASRGHRDRVNGGLTLSPATVERVMKKTAQDHACPDPPLFHYPDPDLTPDYTALCEGSATNNGFYGEGIVDAFAASKKSH